MKWLFLIRSPGGLGGLESRSKALGRHLLKHEHDLTFAYCGVNCYHELEKEYPDRCSSVTVSAACRDSLRLATVWWAWRFLRKHKPTAILLFNAKRTVFLPFLVAARFADVERVLVHHGGPPPAIPGGMGGQYLGGVIRGFHFHQRLKRFCCRLAYLNVTDCLFNNTNDRDAWIRSVRCTKATSRVWLPPVEVSRFAKTTAEKEEARRTLRLGDSFVFGSVGRLDPRKSFSDLIRAFSTVRDSIGNATLIIVGHGPENEQLQALAQQLGISEHVRFAGGQHDVAPYLAAMDVFVLPSTSESLGIAIVEAMASRLPVIVSDLPGPRRVVLDGEAGLIFPPRNTQRLAAAMIELAKDETKRERLAENGLQRARQFDSDAVVGKLMEWVQDGRKSRRCNYTDLSEHIRGETP